MQTIMPCAEGIRRKRRCRNLHKHKELGKCQCSYCCSCYRPHAIVNRMVSDHMTKDGRVVHAGIPAPQETELRGSQEETWKYNKTLSQNKKWRARSVIRFPLVQSPVPLTKIIRIILTLTARYKICFYCWLYECFTSTASSGFNLLNKKFNRLYFPYSFTAKLSKMHQVLPYTPWPITHTHIPPPHSSHTNIWNLLYWSICVFQHPPKSTVSLRVCYECCMSCGFR